MSEKKVKKHISLTEESLQIVKSESERLHINESCYIEMSIRYCSEFNKQDSISKSCNIIETLEQAQRLLAKGHLELASNIIKKIESEISKNGI